ncbi:hypothetical protein Hdeb2414_s0013g00413231 [Helianthus debilis subsp. tardiflorus]
MPFILREITVMMPPRCAPTNLEEVGYGFFFTTIVKNKIRKIDVNNKIEQVKLLCDLETTVLFHRLFSLIRSRTAVAPLEWNYSETKVYMKN